MQRLAADLRYPSVRYLLIELTLVLIAVPLSWVGAEIYLSDRPPFADPPRMTVTILLICSVIFPLLLRRRFPLSILILVTPIFLLIRLMEVPEFQISSVAIVAAFYAAGRHGKSPQRNVVRGISLASIMAFLVLSGFELWGDRAVMGLTTRLFVLNVLTGVSFNVLLFVVTWWWGNSSRRQQDRERELAARTLELEASRDENARRAVMDERVRIAREIHDVVAHHVSVMGVQAGAARRVVSKDPQLAETPLRAIESSSREAVSELHRLLGFLRRADEPTRDDINAESLSPLPGISQLHELRRQLAEAGLALRFNVSGNERPLPPSVDLSAYRIVQEALTNTLKYAGVDQAEVSLEYGETSLAVYVGDRGRGPSLVPSDRLGGAGLQGMAERVALLGGSLSHGARQGGGFEVNARLPYDGVVSAAPSILPVELEPLQ